MLHLALNGLRAHARRFVSTTIAIVMGVGFLVAVLIASATSQQAFDQLFSAATSTTSAVVRSGSSVSLGFGEFARSPIDSSYQSGIASLPGVAAVAPVRVGVAGIVGADGEVVGGDGPPRQSQQWIDDEELNPWVLVDGTAPVTAEEIVIDQRSARLADLSVGDSTTVYTPTPTELVVSGIATLGSHESSGPVTTAQFSEAGALAHIVTDPAHPDVDMYVVRGEPGLSQTELAHRLQAELGDDVEVLTGAQWTEESAAMGDEFVGFIRPVLLTFAIISLLVATFSINNTFAIVAAQRTRDAALLRALGASRGHVIGASLLEAAIVGVFGALIGIGVGVGIGAGLMAVLNQLAAFGSPALVVSGSTVAAGLVTGVVVTVIAAMSPVVRASRVAPIDALRSAAAESSTIGRARLGFGIVMLVVSAICAGLVVANNAGQAIAGLSAATLLVGVIVSSPFIARVVISLFGILVGRLSGVSGTMATRNAVRNPRRTAATATALVIGVSIVALSAVFASSMKASITNILSGQLSGDAIVSASEAWVGIPEVLRERLDALDEVASSTGIGIIPVHLDGEDTVVSFADAATIESAVDLDMQQGRAADVVANTVAVSSSYALEHDVELGSSVPMRFVDGVTREMTVVATYGEDLLAGPMFIDASTVAQVTATVGADQVVLLAAPGYSSEQVVAAARDLATEFGATVDTPSGFADSQAAMLDQLLMIVYVLLGLSVVIALMGIANTISLSTMERVREVGLLRAVGQQRRQVRSMIRWEAVMVSCVGTVMGLAVGAASAAVVMISNPAGFDSVAVPWSHLGVIAATGALAGVLAAGRPARRAARTDVLGALATS